MYRRNRREMNTVDMLTRPGFDWTCGESSRVGRTNVESFLLMLTRSGVEDLILGSKPVINKNWRGQQTRSASEELVDGKDLLYVGPDLRVRVRLEFYHRDVPAAGYIEIEKESAGTRKKYRCESPDVVIRVIRRFQDLRRMQELEAAIAASKKGGEE